MPGIGSSLGDLKIGAIYGIDETPDGHIFIITADGYLLDSRNHNL